jgi:hypothetical protein
VFSVSCGSPSESHLLSFIWTVFTYIGRHHSLRYATSYLFLTCTKPIWRFSNHPAEVSMAIPLCVALCFLFIYWVLLHPQSERHRLYLPPLPPPIQQDMHSSLITIFDLLAACTLVALATSFSYRRERSRLLYPPGPRGLPLIGHFLTFPRNFVWLTFTKWGQQYGRTCIPLICS